MGNVIGSPTVPVPSGRAEPVNENLSEIVSAEQDQQLMDAICGVNLGGKSRDKIDKFPFFDLFSKI